MTPEPKEPSIRAAIKAGGSDTNGAPASDGGER
jgi:hypothetical protein